MSMATDRLKRQEAVRRYIYGPNAISHFDEQKVQQKKRCAICGLKFSKKNPPQQDHDVKCCKRFTDSFGTRRLRACGQCLRGLLCSRCNWMLAAVEDVKFVKKAKAYLRRWQ